MTVRTKEEVLNELKAPEPKTEMDLKLEVINRANECGVLMALLCEKMGLVPSKTTHNEFVMTFSDIQKRSLEYQKEMQEMYVSTQQANAKVKKIPRKKS